MNHSIICTSFPNNKISVPTNSWRVAPATPAERRVAPPSLQQVQSKLVRDLQGFQWKITCTICMVHAKIWVTLWHSSPLPTNEHLGVEVYQPRKFQGVFFFGGGGEIFHLWSTTWESWGNPHISNTKNPSKRTNMKRYHQRTWYTFSSSNKQKYHI